MVQFARLFYDRGAGVQVHCPGALPGCCVGQLWGETAPPISLTNQVFASLEPLKIELELSNPFFSLLAFITIFSINEQLTIAHSGTYFCKRFMFCIN